MSTSSIISRSWTKERLAAARARLRHTTTRAARFAGKTLRANASQSLRDADAIIRERIARKTDRIARDRSCDTTPLWQRKIRGFTAYHIGLAGVVRISPTRSDTTSHDILRVPRLRKLLGLQSATVHALSYYAPIRIWQDAAARWAAREQRRADRQCAEAARAASPGRILRLHLDRLCAAAGPRIEGLIRAHYRQAAGKWAGGGNSYLILPGSPSASSATKRVRSKHGNWSGTDCDFLIRVQADWSRQVEHRRLAVLDGLVTISANKCGDNVYLASWIRQGRGLAIYAEHGWIAVDGDHSFHSTKSAKAATAGLRRKINAQSIPQDELDARRAKRQEASESRKRRIAERLIARLAKYDLSDIGHVVVHRDDSLKAGNCEPGTDQFVAKIGLGESATIAEISARIATNPVEAARYAATTTGKQFFAACLIAIRRDKTARRALLS